MGKFFMQCVPLLFFLLHSNPWEREDRFTQILSGCFTSLALNHKTREIEQIFGDGEKNRTTPTAFFWINKTTQSGGRLAQSKMEFHPFVAQFFSLLLSSNLEFGKTTASSISDDRALPVQGIYCITEIIIARRMSVILRKIFRSLNGPKMTFQQRQVRVKQSRSCLGSRNALKKVIFYRS